MKNWKYIIFLLLCYFITSNAWATPDKITNLTALTGSGDGEVNLTWIYPGPGDLPENEQYAIQHSTYIITWSTSSAIFIDTGPVTTGALQSYTVTGLTNEATYFFRIWTSSSSITDWSPISYGATTWVNIVPSKITNLSALAGYKKVTLNWTAPGDNGILGNIEDGKYEIRCSTTKAFVNNDDWDNASTGYPYRISWGTDTAPGNSEIRVITGLINNVTYYFAIKTRDEISNNWSVLNSTSPIPYGIPFNSLPYVNLSSPANDTIVSTQTPVFDWVGSDSDPGDNITYTIRYSTKQNFEVFSSSEGLTISSYTPTANLMENATYWWSVLAIDSENYETLSETWTIRINATNDYAPDPFDLVSPTDNYIATTPKPSFDWEDSSDDDPGDTITYSLRYSTNPDFKPLNQKAGLTDSTYTVTSDLFENATYYWKVVAIDSGNLIRESNQLDWYIRINAANESPYSFSLSTPSYEQEVFTLKPTFEWDAAVDPDPDDTVSYLLYYSTYSNFSSSTTKPVSQTSYTPTSNLLDEVTYYWKVKALDEDSSALDIMSMGGYWEFYTQYDDSPTAFGLLFPTGTTTDLTPDFEWEHNEPLGGDPWDNVTYTLYYSTYSNYLSSTSVWGLVDVSTTPDSNLLDNATYFWKVKAFDGADNSTWSNEISSYFWTNRFNDTPSTFSLISPVNNYTSTITTPVFDWHDSIDVDPGDSITYTLYYSTSYDFASSTTVPNLPTSSHTPTYLLQDNSTYFWKVKAVDGSTETWSNETTWLFWTNQSNDPPEDFGLISPANNYTSTVTTPVFDWHDSIDVDPNDSVAYTLYYSSYSNFISSTTEPDLADSSYTPSIPLQDNTTYYWKVRAYDSYEAFYSTGPYLFWTNQLNDTPTVFGLISPADSITIIGQKPDFNWYDSIDIDPNDSVTYTLYYSTYAAYDSSTTVGVSISSHTPSFDLSDDSTYYWKVKAYDTNGDQRWSTETNWKFLTNVSNDPPDTFGLIFPTNSYVTTDLTLIFDWEDSDDPNPVDTVTYTLCYSTYSTYDSSTTVQLSVSSYTPSIPLQDNTTYFWKVKAEDNVSTGTWSNETTWLFWTNVENDTPTAFGLISPVNDHKTSNLKPTFKWQNSSDVDPGDSITYILYYSTYSNFLSSSVISLTDLTYTPPGNLNENATYWWKVRVDDLNGAERWSNEIWKLFVRLLHTPEVVEGVKGNLSNDMKSFSLSWNPVTRNTDGSPINDSGGYHIYRSDLISSLGDGTPAATVGAATLNWSDDTVNKRIFYYVVNAFDTSGNESENSVIVDSSRDENVIAVSKDQEALLVIPNEINKVLYSQNNSYGDDLKIIVERKNADEKGKVIRSWEFKVLKCSDNTEIKNFKFDSPVVDIQLAYENGSGMAGSFGKAVFHAPSQYDSQVGIFYHNGVEYVKLGGHIDSDIKAINLKSRSLGKYRVQQVQRATEFELSWVGTIGPTKVFTPNGDEINDEINFVFENPKESIASGEIYDITGAVIASMVKGQNNENSLMWDGRNNDGEIADKGVYIYQIKAEGKIINGTVILAK